MTDITDMVFARTRIDEIKPGDIVLFTSPGHFAKEVHAAGTGHGAIVNKPYFFVEFCSGGKGLVSLTPNDVYLVHRPS